MRTDLTSQSLKHVRISYAESRWRKIKADNISGLVGTPDPEPLAAVTFFIFIPPRRKKIMISIVPKSMEIMFNAEKRSPLSSMQPILGSAGSDDEALHPLHINEQSRSTTNKTD